MMLVNGSLSVFPQSEPLTSLVVQGVDDAVSTSDARLSSASRQ